MKGSRIAQKSDTDLGQSLPSSSDPGANLGSQVAVDQQDAGLLKRFCHMKDGQIALRVVQSTGTQKMDF